MKKFVIFSVLGLLAVVSADPGPHPYPDHLKPKTNQRQQRTQGGNQQPQQPQLPQQFQQQSLAPPPYQPQQQQYPQQQQNQPQQPQYPQQQQQQQYPSQQPQYPQQQQQYPPQQPQYPQQQQQYPPQQPYQQQPNPYQQQPYSAPPQQSPYAPQQQQKPGRQGRLLDPSSPSNLNSVQPAPELFTRPKEVPNALPENDPNEKYNKRYPLTPPVLKFKIGLVADMDFGSKIDGTEGKPDEFQSILREGNLLLTQNADDPSESNVTIEWNEAGTRQIKGSFSYGGRGMELSTLNVFAEKVYSCDDSTGIVYEIPLDGNQTEPITPIPWRLLANGNGTEPNGFKCEWASLKDGDLWIGGQGINKVDENGEIIDNKNQKFVKRVSPSGEITTIDWAKNYERVADQLEIDEPGYVTHEAVQWSDDLQRWMFIPKRISKEAYTEESDAQKGSNAILIADEHFEDIQVGYIGDLVPDRGFSGMKFIPGTQDQMILALKVKKANSGDESYIMAFDLKGNILLEEVKFADQKYQGIEFL